MRLVTNKTDFLISLIFQQIMNKDTGKLSSLKIIIRKSMLIDNSINLRSSIINGFSNEIATSDRSNNRY